MDRTTQHFNEFNQPISFPIENWTKREFPTKLVLEGLYCRLEKLDSNKHLEDLYKAYSDSKDDIWTYIPVWGPFESKAKFSEYIEFISQSKDPRHYAVIDKTSGRAVGTLSLMRVNEEYGTIEVGFVIFSDQLKKTRISTEAQFLLASYAFDELGYRRYEWKCDALNKPSITAAVRLGFVFEGIFRNGIVYKGRNRDTAWYSMIDSDWAEIKRRLVAWLDPDNFDSDGKQKKSLTEC